MIAPRRLALVIVNTLLGATVVMGASALAAPAANAAGCPSSSVGGSPVGKFTLDGVGIPIKSAPYPKGGVLEPPPSAKIVGVSTRHRPLDARTGTTVLVWHSRFGVGCDGTLNRIINRPVGTTFTIADAKGKARTYRIATIDKVKFGDYKPQWFRLKGPRQLTLITCTDLERGKFTHNLVLTAVPA